MAIGILVAFVGIPPDGFSTQEANRMSRVFPIAHITYGMAISIPAAFVWILSDFLGAQEAIRTCRLSAAVVALQRFHSISLFF